MDSRLSTYEVGQYVKSILDNPDSQETIIVTPETLSLMGGDSGHIRSDIVMAGFGKNAPPVLPNGYTFEGDVWLVSSILRHESEVTIKGNLYLIESDIEKLDSGTKIEGFLVMDKDTYDLYRMRRTKNRKVPNLGIRIMDYSELRQKLSEVVSKAHRIDALEFIEHTGQEVEYFNTDEGIRIVTNKQLFLIGPFLYSFDGIYEIDADLTILNELGQKLDDVKIKGELSVMGYF
jgi:hypothetical protein